jgi:hypothetical protein
MNMNAGVVYYAEVSMMKPAQDKLRLEDQGPTRQSEQCVKTQPADSGRPKSTHRYAIFGPLSCSGTNIAMSF